ncbi:aldo/keto reductase [Pseudomonas kairouanensis]|uniref:Aldo/keto reductase n=1 Tax=Pseudomonas kairouanensis TaxID=2293832 RepID=A0A4Z0ALN7_9PSED|nr:aldo/keto reductase [Pseudomonas kairouanensis]TFY87154.1 aldo/keto reductase [Pseudomonas kairouanensis]
MSEPRIPTLELNDGIALPAIGFGTYTLKGSEGVDVIQRAIRSGYHLIDSAVNYENEGALGEAVRRSEVAREQLRITSKLPGRHYEFEAALTTIEESLYRSQLDYFDLYLLHWPNPSNGLYVQAWRALVEARKRGWVKSIGVCNFLPEHLDTLIKDSGVTPAVNQIELHPFFPQHEQLAWNKAHGIVTQSWSPLGRANHLLKDPSLQGIAEHLGKSIAQVILRWHYQLGTIALPKASSVERQRENLSLFDFALSADDLAVIARLASPTGRINDQDPAVYEEF